MAKTNLVVIRLRDDEYHRLEGIAAREERDPYAQARYVVRRYLSSHEGQLASLVDGEATGAASPHESSQPGMHATVTDEVAAAV